MPNIAMAALSARALVADLLGSNTGMLFLLVLSIILFSFLYIITKSIAVAIPGTSTRKIADLEARMEWLLQQLDKRDKVLLSLQAEQKRLHKLQGQQVEQQKRTVRSCLEIYNFCTYLYAQHRKPSLSPIDTFFSGIISDRSARQDYGWQSEAITPSSGSASPSSSLSSGGSLESDPSATTSPSPSFKPRSSDSPMSTESPLPQTPDSRASRSLLLPIKTALNTDGRGDSNSSGGTTFGSGFLGATSRANTLAIDLEINNIVKQFEPFLDSPKSGRRKSRMTLRQRLSGT